MNRRLFMASAAVGGLMLAAPACSGGGRAVTAKGARIPAEFEPMDAVWLGQFSDDEDVLAAAARIASALLGHVDLKFLGRDAEENARIKAQLISKGVDADRIAFFEHPNAPFFVRDYFLFARDEQGRLSVVDFKWGTYGLDGWCRHHLYPAEPSRAERCAAYHNPDDGIVDQAVAGFLGAETKASSLVMEATGSFEVNGRGVLLVSEPLALQRNPAMSKEEIEAAFLALPGITKVIWLGEGAAEDPHMMSTIVGDYVGWGTGGHTDEFVRFADARTILLAWVEDEAPVHPIDQLNRRRMIRNFEILSTASDQDGRPFTIVKVPLPKPVEREVILEENPESALGWPAGVFPASEGRRVGDRVIHVAASSYLNFIVANDIVLLPSYVEDGTPQLIEDQVKAIIEDAFPGRTVKFINATRLNWMGGGIHCATNSQLAMSSVA